MPSEGQTIPQQEASVAVVTGGARGIGLATVKELSEKGHKVIIADLDISSLPPEYIKEGIYAFPLDVSEEKAVKEFFIKIKKEIGTVGILVNSAGIMKSGKIETMELTQWEKTLAINLRGVFLTCREVIGHIKELNWGRIVNISSLAGKSGGIMVGADYAASKAGIIAFTKCLARQIAVYGATANCVAPGTTETEMVNKGFSAKQKQTLAEKIPLGRLGKPEEVARVISFLIGPGGDFITGATIDVNGGLLMD